ncbi:tRNA epoxyqueuosine(34) reductase QueG [Prochlorococcus sp. MIT 1341]|uniref:tRNA epoxyqueuosine(34) reductase QueG n=1 Tax=Prochlorococcus sp. MIT 1341 TaxID=3096221 RepID=UPI002A74E6D5|nr:tRNA epoxyqueuosine(34) reductase QueG [Prochlorococcus sp. MIT 1341]
MKIIESQSELTKALKEVARKQGFNPIGIAKVPGSNRLKLRNQALERWLAAGNHAEMKWMETSTRKKINELLVNAKSILSVGLNYYVKEKQHSESLLIARYAWGEDYHKILKDRLKIISKWLKIQRPNCQFKICVDTSPLLEKAWAEEAGIGWIGKHSNLINQKNGSWMVIGHLLCTEKLTADKPSKPLCGTCEECIKACPTNAIHEPFVVDSRKCIAYHTIENRQENLPINIAAEIGKWVAGCDICQEICPWNKSSIKESNDPDITPREWIMKLTYNQALSWDEKTWQKKLKGSALKRIKPWMWRRNALATKNSISSSLKGKEK